MSSIPLDADLAPAVSPVADDARDDLDDDHGVASRQRRLAESLVRLRSRTSAPAQLDRRIALVGGLLIAGGVVLVLLGWYGAAHTSRLYLQIPYLISGGLLGVTLAVAGGCTYLASWLTRLVHEERGRADEALAVARRSTEVLERIEALLATGAAADAVVGGAAVTNGRSATGLVATPSGRLAHRPGCPTVAGRTDLRPASLDGDGMAPCRMCGSGAAEGEPLSSPAPPE